MSSQSDRQIAYVCGDCGREGCKLWREYQTFLEHQKLRCGACALKNQGKDGPIDDEGFRLGEFGRTDQIGWLVPAVLTPERETFWGYASVPGEGVEWWQGLPT